MMSIHPWAGAEPASEEDGLALLAAKGLMMRNRAT
jgi:hypothetical protein